MDINLIHIYIYGYGSIPINTIFRGLFTSINPSYFDVNYRGTIGFDTLPYSIVRIIIIQLDVVPLSLQASWISGDWHDWVSWHRQGRWTRRVSPWISLGRRRSSKASCNGSHWPRYGGCLKISVNLCLKDFLTCVWLGGLSMRAIWVWQIELVSEQFLMFEIWLPLGTIIFHPLQFNPEIAKEVPTKSRRSAETYELFWRLLVLS